LTVIKKGTVKDKHKQCFETGMVEVALAGMEFPDSMLLLSDPDGLGTHQRVCTPPRTSMLWYRKLR
jgi:hypothetical protein